MKRLSAPKIENKVSLCASIIRMIVMDDVFVPCDAPAPNVPATF